MMLININEIKRWSGSKKYIIENNFLNRYKKILNISELVNEKIF